MGWGAHIFLALLSNLRSGVCQVAPAIRYWVARGDNLACLPDGDCGGVVLVPFFFHVDCVVLNGGALSFFCLLCVFCDYLTLYNLGIPWRRVASRRVASRPAHPP